MKLPIAVVAEKFSKIMSSASKNGEYMDSGYKHTNKVRKIINKNHQLFSEDAVDNNTTREFENFCHGDVYFAPLKQLGRAPLFVKSVQDMVDQLIARQTEGGSIETLVIVGHGGDDCIGVGACQAAGYGILDPRRFRYFSENLVQRYIGLNNTNHWKGPLEKLKPYCSSHVNIVLLACSTGIDPIKLSCFAQHFSEALHCSVSVYGTQKDITNLDILKFLTSENMSQILVGESYEYEYPNKKNLANNPRDEDVKVLQFECSTQGRKFIPAMRV